MTRLWWPWLLVVIVGCGDVATGSGSASCDEATTQRELAECAGQVRQDAEDELAAFVGEYEARLAPSQLESFREAQTAWQAFRRAHCAFQSSRAEGGSAHSMVLGQCMAELTRRRLQELRKLARCAEGDLSCPAPN